MTIIFIEIGEILYGETPSYTKLKEYKINNKLIFLSIPRINEEIMFNSDDHYLVKNILYSIINEDDYTNNVIYVYCKKLKKPTKI